MCVCKTSLKKGEEYIFDFKQKLRFAPGRYTISISCNRFDENDWQRKFYGGESTWVNND